MLPLFTAILLGLFAWLSWRDLKLGLCLLMALLPVYLVRFSAPVPWTLLEAILLINFAVWIVKNYQHLPALFLKLHRDLSIAFWPLVSLFFIASLAVMWAPNLLSALGIWKAYYLEPLLVLIMLTTTFTDAKDWLKALSGLAVSTVVLGFYAIIQKATGLGIPVPWDVEQRVTSVFEYPNALGLFIAPIISAGLILFIGLRKHITFSLWSLALLTGGVTIILSKTEAALVAIPVAVLITLWLAPITRQLKFSLTIGSGLLFGLALLTLPALSEKLLLQDYSGQVRQSQWLETWQLLKDHPVLGAGLSGYPTALTPYHDSRLYEIFQYPHNVFLNIWVELGLPGLIISLWLMASLFILALRGRQKWLTLVGLAALATMLVHGLVDVPFFKNDLAVLTSFFISLVLTSTSNKTISSS